MIQEISQIFGHNRWSARAICVGGMLGLLAISSGCNTFGNGKLLQELRNENERLLAEFRAERERREQLGKALQVAESRLSESEKLLARQYQAAEPGRLSSLQNQPAAQRLGGYSNLPSNASAFNGDLPGAGPYGGGSQDVGYQNTDDGSTLKWQRRVN